MAAKRSVLPVVFRRWREQRGYTQREVAEMLGCCEATVCKIESGERPGIRFIRRMREVTGLSLDELLPGGPA